MHPSDRHPSSQQQPSGHSGPGDGAGAARGGGGDDHLVRLQKVMARAGIGSRRACEVLIEAGFVTINGRTVRELPCLVDPHTDRIEVEGRLLQRPERHVYVMLYKPKQTMCTLADPGGRRTVAELVDHPSGVRLYPVGRLDFDTMGLVLMTNDGQLANRLTHPRFGVHKTYRAVVKGSLSDEDIERLEQGIYLAERREGRTVGARRTSRARLTPVKREATRTVLDIELHEGRNRQVRRMMASAGCPVRRLVRIQMGPLSLKGLQIGEWRELTPPELARLRKAARGGDAGEAELTSAGIPRKPRKGGRKPGGELAPALTDTRRRSRGRRDLGNGSEGEREESVLRPIRPVRPGRPARQGEERGRADRSARGEGRGPDARPRADSPAGGRGRSSRDANRPGSRSDRQRPRRG
ncbi:MAG: pseudouridine synthase [Phycisphaerales bacterium]